MEDSNTDKNESLTDMETKKHTESYVTFAKINKYFIIPFLCPVICMLTNFFLSYVNKSNVIKKFELIVPIYIELSYVAAGLLYFFSYFQEKIDIGKESIIYRERTSTITYIYNKSKKKEESLKPWIIIVFLGFLAVLFELLGAYSREKHLFEERLYFMFFIPLFSKIILKENILKHQYLSLIIAIIGITLLIIPVGLKVEKEDLLPNILMFLAAVSFSLFLVLIKYITHVYYISPFKISFYFGLISIGFTFFGFFFYSLIDRHDLSYFNNCFDFDKFDNKFLLTLYFLLTFIFATGLQILILLVIFYFSPILLMVTDIISPMLLWIAISIRDGTEMPEALLYPIGYLIVVFSSLIYNEIIIFNFCGLSEGTKIFVEIRSNKEASDLRKTEYSLKLGIRASDLESNSAGDDDERNSNNS